MPKIFHGAGSTTFTPVNAIFLLNFALYLAQFSEFQQPAKQMFDEDLSLRPNILLVRAHKESKHDLLFLQNCKG